MRSIEVRERRARLGIRHRLAARARTDDDIAAVVRSVVVLHATDPASVVLSALTRMAHPDPARVERALYEDRIVVRMLGMRRTLWTAPIDAAPIVQSSSTLAVAANERRKLEKLVEDAGLASPPGPWIDRVEQAALDAVEQLGEAAATELTPLVTELASRLTLAAGTTYETTAGLSSRVLFLLAADGHLVRARPKGRWTSGQHRWTSMTRWLGAPLVELDPAEARVQWQARAWYLGGHKAQVFDTNGNAGPTIWADGRIVGGWAQRKDGEVVTRLLEDLGRDQTAQVDAAAAQLQILLGDLRVSPRFPTPIDRELSQ